jgi:hypothetical protein
MDKKLTLNVDEELISFAHRYAEETGQSISALFERYLKSLKADLEVKGISSEAKQLYGSLDKGVLK